MALTPEEEEQLRIQNEARAAEEQSQTAGLTEQESDVADSTTREERDQLRLERDNAPKLGVNGMAISEQQRNQIMALTREEQEIDRKMRENGIRVKSKEELAASGYEPPPDPTNEDLGIEVSMPEEGLTKWEQTMASMNERADRLQASELARTNAWHQRLADARARRIGELRDRAITDPGRFSPFQRNALLGLQHMRNGDVPLQDINERNRLRQHEIDIADKGIAQERVKAWGMANQGGVAAGIKAKVESDASRAQHGYFDKNGNYVPGSTVRAAEANGQLKSELNENNWRNRNENTRIIEEGRDRRHQQQLDAGREKNDAWREEKEKDRQANKDKASERTQRIRERQAQQDALREQRDFEAFDKMVGSVNSNLTPEQEKEYQSLKPEERKAWWKGHVGRGAQQSENGAPKNGDRKQFKQGWGTWKDGKWVLDAQ